MAARFHSRRAAWPEGSSAVTFVMALPVLAALLCAIVDFGRAAYLGLEADAAAQAACRYAAERLSEGARDVAGDAVLAAALEQSPSLAFQGVSCDADVFCGQVGDRVVERKRFDAQAGEFVEKEVVLAHRDVSVEVRVRARFLTPVGALALAACGQGDELSLASTARRDVRVPGQGGGS